MNVSLSTLKPILLTSVCEIKFDRRNPKPGLPPTRRMLCSNCFALLNSPEGRLALNYRIARNSPPYDTVQKNLLTTWDIFMQDYRNINMDACELIQAIPANGEFWRYFNERLALLTPQQKMMFQNT